MIHRHRRHWLRAEHRDPAWNRSGAFWGSLVVTILLAGAAIITRRHGWADWLFLATGAAAIRPIWNACKNANLGWARFEVFAFLVIVVEICVLLFGVGRFFK